MKSQRACRTRRRERACEPFKPISVTETFRKRRTTTPLKVIRVEPQLLARRKNTPTPTIRRSGVCRQPWKREREEPRFEKPAAPTPPREGPMTRSELFEHYKRLGMLELFFAKFR
jgi:hypothetical protein